MNPGNNDKGLRHEPLCEARTITEVQSESICPAGRLGPLVARIPVIISQTKVHINIESKVSLDHSVVAIRNCSRNVYLTHCKLLDLGNKKQGKIYLNGYISENIEYAAANSVRNRRTSAEVRYKTVKIPFECATKIEYCTRPVFKTPNEFINVGLPEMEKTLEDTYLSGERMFCELEEVSIREADDLMENPLPEENSMDEPAFDTLTEYMVVSITFTLLQWQAISISRNSPYNQQF